MFYYNDNKIRVNSVIEDGIKATNECIKLKKKYGWSDEKFDEELYKRIIENANRYYGL